MAERELADIGEVDAVAGPRVGVDHLADRRGLEHRGVADRPRVALKLFDVDDVAGVSDQQLVSVGREQVTTTGRMAFPTWQPPQRRHEPGRVELLRPMQHLGWLAADQVVAHADPRQTRARLQDSGARVDAPHGSLIPSQAVLHSDQAWRNGVQSRRA